VKVFISNIILCVDVLKLKNGRKFIIFRLLFILINRRNCIDNDKLYSLIQLTQNEISHEMICESSKKKYREYRFLTSHWNCELHNSNRDKNFARLFYGILRNTPQMEHELFPTDCFKLLVTKHHNV